ncbi:MAG: UvrD-helicase domain-containing protein, partial [bacterium]|nr:UvrD-helicase domain-containing protein [bacterium]
AAYEMMLRIRKKIQAAGFMEQVARIDKAYITTFDSFALSIVKKYHDLLHISSSVSIIDHSIIEVVKKEELDRIFEEYYESRNPLFEKLITDFCIKDDKELKQGILNVNAQLDMKYDKDDYLAQYLERYYDRNKIDVDILEFGSYLQKKLSKIWDYLEEIRLAVDGDYYDKLEKSLLPLLSCQHYDDMVSLLEIRLPNLPKGCDESIKKCKEEVSRILKDVKKECAYINQQEIIDSILMTADYAKMLIEIIRKLDQRITEYKRTYNVYEFVDISKLAIQVVKEHAEIREELKNYFHEIMIDEYQDTSDLQETFIGLIENHNVYMVGDIKQSIYRFRNANPIIFKDKYDRYKEHDGGIKIDLNKNFRSREEVLNDINLIFDLIMDTNIGGADYKDGHQMVFGNTSYHEQGHTNQNYATEIYQYHYDSKGNYTKDEIEAFIVASDILKKMKEKYQIFDKDQGVLRDVQYYDFVILMDRSSKFDLYKKILEYYGIPLTILKDENIMHHTEIYLIQNLLKLILKVKNQQYDKEFEYAFLSIGRSYLFQISDQELFEIITNHTYFKTDLFCRIQKIVGELDYHDNEYILHQIIEQFQFYDKAITVGNIQSVMNDLEYMLDLARNMKKIDYSMEDFSNYLSEMIQEGKALMIPANSVEENSVKIMTIHKSKGLEYPICYYTGLHNRFNVSDLKEKIMFSNRYGIILPYFLEGYGETIYKTLYKDQFYSEEISEKIRLFYVALTRSCEKMIMVVNMEDDSDMMDCNYVSEATKLKYRSFLEFLKSIYDKIQPFIQKIDLNNIVITSDYKKIRSIQIEDYLDHGTCPLDDFVETCYEGLVEEKTQYSKVHDELTLPDEKKSMEFGIQFHYLLEILNFKEPNLDRLNLSLFMRRKIEKFLQQDILKDVSEANIYKEYRFMNSFGTIGIIDCMLEYNDKIIIIDYKLKNVHDEEYRKQLHGYCEYIHTICDKPIFTYLYSIIDEKMIRIEG